LLDDEIQVHLHWLQFNVWPEEEVIEKWNIIFDYRMSILKGSANQVEILQELPILKQSFGYKLV